MCGLASAAAEFSFLLSIPAIIGALLLESVSAGPGLSGGEAALLVASAAVAFASGYAALRLLVLILGRGRFHRFSWYLIPAGTGGPHLVRRQGLMLTAAASCVRFTCSRGNQAARQGERMLEKVYKPGDIEKKWSDAWTGAGVFTADASSEDASYCIVLPPPNVTGMLTVGHALGTTVQDILCRWKRINGREVLWLSGTDHAGIATQNVVERSLAAKGTSRQDLGRGEVPRGMLEMEGRISRQDRRAARPARGLPRLVARGLHARPRRLEGRTGGLRAPARKGPYIQGRYIVNWCPRCGTAISDEEVEFREEDSKLWYIAYPFADGGGEVVVGTTRPETMLGDVAVAMSPGHERAKELGAEDGPPPADRPGNTDNPRRGGRSRVRHGLSQGDPRPRCDGFRDRPEARARPVRRDRLGRRHERKSRHLCGHGQCRGPQGGPR